MFYLNKELNRFCLFFDFMGFYFNNDINRLENKMVKLTRNTQYIFMFYSKFQRIKTVFW